ncbi:chloride channel protein [Marinomonas ostreistagni]|uniref:chloride channel protein n=1 Tax=Marinomonas ostreistagni TaxID=359209 RepID=UPI00194E3716|nr:chloride channel protein [Marinomonas ostreistagni]MBM6551370.1 chloride channel protein [Marinomonas ostreistagni]
MDFIERWRNREIAADDLLLLSGLALICGVLSGLTMTGLVELVSWVSSSLLPNHAEDYEGLAPEYRFLLPVVACGVLAFIWYWIPQRNRGVGIPFLVERLNYHQGHLPFINALVQFVGAVLSLIGGLSVGKESPAVHIGATFGSQIAQRFRLSYIGVDTLVASGIAGAISAAFQTPLAGVLFAYEVIYHEYRLRMVLPILLSAIVATGISQGLLGRFELFDLHTLTLPIYNVDMLMAYAVLALLVVLASAVFYQLQRFCWTLAPVPMPIRFITAGVLTGAVGILVPQALGSSYDTLNALLLGEALMVPLLLLAFAKVFLTSTAIGLGIPGGMIGPTFVIGGLLGAQVSLMVETPMQPMAEMTLFVLLGMASMMATVFQAPLAAIVAIVEMTHTSQTIGPAILIIVVTCTAVRLLLHQDSIFVERMNALGLVSEWSPVQRVLRQHDIRGVATRIEIIPELLHFERVRDLASSMIDYGAIQKDERYIIVSVSEMLEKLQELDVGPQPWLTAKDDRQAMDVLQAVVGKPVQVVDSTLSLAELLSWLHEHEQHQVLVNFTQSQELWLVTSKQLDHMLLKG